MQTTMYDKLLQLPLFQGLCKSDFTNILEKVKLHFHKYNKGSRVVKQGDTCNQLIFILGGQIMSEAIDEGHLYVLNEILDSPSIIEPYSLFGMHTHYTASYWAATDIHVLSIDKSYILSQLTKYEIFNLNYLNMLSNRAQTVYYKLWNTHIGNTQEKIANFLQLRCSVPMGTKTLSIKMEDLAQLIDDTRINVSKILNDWQNKKLIKLSRKKIIINDLKALIENIDSNSQTEL